MGMRALKTFQYVVIVSFIINIFLCSGNCIKRSDDGGHRQAQHQRFMLTDRKVMENEPESMPELDDVTPMTTVPIVNPTTPTTSTPTINPNDPNTGPVINPNDPNTGPVVGTPTGGGVQGGSPAQQSWCIAKQGASETALQVALDYACGYGGADCSQVQSGGNCFNPDTIRDHASYAFNSYYQNNPVPTSCDFGGTATITNTDPSTANCQYPTSSSSSTSTVPNTNNPYGTASPVFGSVPSDSTGTDSSYAAASLVNISHSILVCALMIFITINHQ